SPTWQGKLPASYDRKTAWRDCTVVLDELAAEGLHAAGQVRALELSRLDELHRALWPLGLRGDLQAIDRLLKIAERRARLLGLDAPTKGAGVSREGDTPYQPQGAPPQAIDSGYCEAVARTLAQYGQMLNGHDTGNGPHLPEADEL